MLHRASLAPHVLDSLDEGRVIFAGYDSKIKILIVVDRMRSSGVGQNVYSVYAKVQIIPGSSVGGEPEQAGAFDLRQCCNEKHCKFIFLSGPATSGHSMLICRK